MVVLNQRNKFDIIFHVGDDFISEIAIGCTHNIPEVILNRWGLRVYELSPIFVCPGNPAPTVLNIAHDKSVNDVCGVSIRNYILEWLVEWLCRCIGRKKS